ncbi:hypothetical protein BDY24DRAFT_4142 [Mrakia frigida]|uniref:uncharacterized protein n=1 Tax=Mrakia frigida TaxID=29902 RepID=UPI003FCC09AD
MGMAFAQMMGFAAISRLARTEEAKTLLPRVCAEALDISHYLMGETSSFEIAATLRCPVSDLERWEKGTTLHFCSRCRTVAY